MKRCSTSLVIREMQTRSRHPSTPPRAAGIGQPASVDEDVDKSKLSCTSGGSVKRRRALDNGLGVPQTLTTESLRDTAILLLGTHPREMITYVHTKVQHYSPLPKGRNIPRVPERTKGYTKWGTWIQRAVISPIRATEWMNSEHMQSGRRQAQKKTCCKTEFV